MAVRSGRSQTLSIVIAGDAKGVQRATGEASASVDQLSNRIKSSAVDVARAWATFQGIQFLRGAAEAAASLAASQETVDAVHRIEPSLPTVTSDIDKDAPSSGNRVPAAGV